MCVVSNVGDFYSDRWKWVPDPPTFYPTPDTVRPPSVTIGVSREEFEVLRREVAEMKELLRAAKRIDELTGQPDCEMEDKVAVLRRVAELVGIDISDVLGKDEA
jgi:hypothetical protein